MRTKRALLNMITSAGGQMLASILAFVGRMIFIRCLSVDYLGVNGLFSELLTLFSLAELGIGNAMIYGLYKPIADGDEKKISQYMNLYRYLYRLVAIAVTVMGLCCLPFLPIIIRDAHGISIGTLRFYYILYLLSTVSSYCMCYKQSLIMADQKQYINNTYQYGMRMFQSVGQIVVLLLFKNYTVYLMIQIGSQILLNVLLSRKADSMYPCLRNKREKLPDEERKSVFKSIKAMVVHKLSGVLVNNTDNILLSAMCGITAVGLYSNYQLLFTNLKTLLGHFYNSLTASIGNLIAEGDNKKIIEMFETLQFMIFMLFGYFSGGIFLLSDRFIEVFFGKEFIFSRSIVAVLSLNFYFLGRRQVILLYRNAMGLFEKDQVKAIVEVIINIVMSVILAKRYGTIGIFIGTTISTVTTSLWVEPYILFKYGFKEDWEKRFQAYLIRFIFDLLVMAMLVTICVKAMVFVSHEGIVGFLLSGMLYTAIFLLFIAAVYGRTSGMKECIGRTKQIVERKKKNAL